MSTYSWRPRLCHATSVALMFLPLHSTYLNLPRTLHKDYGFLGFVFTLSIKAKLFLLSATLSVVNCPYFPLPPCAFLILYFYSSWRWNFVRISTFFFFLTASGWAPRCCLQLPSVEKHILVLIYMHNPTRPVKMLCLFNFSFLASYYSFSFTCCASK